VFVVVVVVCVGGPDVTVAVVAAFSPPVGGYPCKQSISVINLCQAKNCLNSDVRAIKIC